MSAGGGRSPRKMSRLEQRDDLGAKSAQSALFPPEQQVRQAQAAAPTCACRAP
jgi:hypothetical protein